jgi:hypothetical protein
MTVGELQAEPIALPLTGDRDLVAHYPVRIRSTCDCFVDETGLRNPAGSVVWPLDPMTATMSVG